MDGVVSAAAVTGGGRRAVGVRLGVVAAGALLRVVGEGRGAGGALRGTPLLLQLLGNARRRRPLQPQGRVPVPEPVEVRARSIDSHALLCRTRANLNTPMQHASVCVCVYSH